MQLIMTREQFSEIKYLTDKCRDEISGMGTILINNNGDFELEKLYLIEQEVSGASTDLNANAIAQAMIESGKNGDKGDLCFWWHSHVNMSAFFSTTDISTIKDSGKQGQCLAMVINKRGEYKLAYCQGKPLIYMDSGIELVIKDNIMLDYAKIDKEYDLKVKTKSYKQHGMYNGMHHNFADYDTYDSWNNYGEYYRGGNRHNQTPPPLIFDGKAGRYVDNPAYEEYQKAKKEKREQKKLEKEQSKNRDSEKQLNKEKYAANQQAIREIEEEEDKAKKDFSALPEKERMKWFAKFIDFFGVNPVDTEELSLFYANHTKLSRITRD